MFFWVILCIAFVFRVWLSAFGGIHPDEAYYWVWTENLSWGYYDHPPMLAWLIALSQALVTRTIPQGLWDLDPLFYSQIAFRLVPYFFTSVLCPWFLGLSIELVQRQPLRLTQMFVLTTMPLFVFGPQVITPDTPFFAFWAMALYFHLLLVDSRPLNARIGSPTPFRPYLSVLIGLCLALSFYSKYSAVLAVFLFVVTGAGLANSVVAGISMLVFLIPHFAWNATTGLENGAGIFFQLKNGFGGTQQIRPVYKWAGDLWLTQIALWSPLLFALWIVIPLRDLRRLFDNRKVHLFTGTLFMWGFVPLAFFSLTTLQRRAEGNWPLIGAVAATVLVLAKLKRRPTWLGALILSNLIMVAATGLILTHNLELAKIADRFSARAAELLRKPSRLEEFSDWQHFHELVFEVTRRDEAPILVRSYQLLSVLKFYDRLTFKEEQMGTRLKIWASGSRPSQYNLMPAYLPDPSVKSYWLLSRNNEGIPNYCRSRSVIDKGNSGQISFEVYRCDEP